MTRIAILVFSVLPATLPAQETGDGLPPAPSFTVHRTTGPIVIDGVLDEPDWDRADPISLDWEFLPGDNVPPPVQTTCRVMYDELNLYMSCRALDPRPGEIRAHFADRDDRTRVPLDDHVIFLVDPFNDERRGFQFRINAAGVQMDAVLVRTEGFEDFSWNAIWQSEARITDTGYDVEVAVPFSSLRFPVSDEVQTWGFIIERSYPRNLRYRMRSSAMDRNRTCILCRGNKVSGFQGITPGGTVEVVPTVTTIRSDARLTPGQPFSPNTPNDFGDIDTNVGVDMRWGITPSMSLNGMINPDFSQVEADVAQLAVNRRFALFFPEQRPFFLEGADYFLTPLQAVFTRTIAAPDGGVKLTGKNGPDAVGVVAARDVSTNFLFPANQGSQTGALNQEAYTAIGRYRRDLGGGTYVGGLYTGRMGTSYSNHVAGADLFYQATRSNTVRVQLLRSDTEYPGAVAVANGQPAAPFTGGALTAQFRHASRLWAATAGYTDLSPDFRADAGFIPRVDLRTGTASLGRTFWGPADGWFTRLQTIAAYSRSHDHAGDLTDQAMRFAVAYQGPSQSSAVVQLSRLAMVVRGTRHDLNRFEPQFQVRPSGSVTFGAALRMGDFVDFTNNRKSFGMSFTPAAQFNVGQRVAFNVSHVFQRLSFMGNKVYSANLSQGRFFYHFNVRTLVRAILQYRIVDRDLNQFVSPGGRNQQDKRLFTQFLFQYKLNPQTAVFAGYSDGHTGTDVLALERNTRTIFLKFGYGWRP